MSSPPALLPLRLPPGVDLRGALEVMPLLPGWGGAFVVAGIGSLVDPRLRYADADEAVVLPGPHEILTLSGSLAPGAAHLHMSIADGRGRVRGGHVVRGNVVRTTVELLLTGLEGWQLTRRFDAATGFDELHVAPADASRVRP